MTLGIVPRIRRLFFGLVNIGPIRSEAHKEHLIVLFSGASLLALIFSVSIGILFTSKWMIVSLTEKIFSTSIVIAFLFWGIHCIGYFDKILKSTMLYNIPISCRLPEKENMPNVAILIPVFNEEPYIVEPTIAKCTQISYPNFDIYLLDDSTNKEICTNLIELSKKNGINYIYRGNRKGYKAGAINNAISNLNTDAKYILVVDADHRLESNILCELIPLLENDPELSFIQTPQYYTEKMGNSIEVSFSLQQHIYYKHICRGMNINNSLGISGTNAIIRISHLREIGGFDETYIVEDLATSFTFHLFGYRSLYIDKVYAEGIAPPSLSAYITQQTRWAYGSIQIFGKIISTFIRYPRLLKIPQWWDYALNSSWYLLSWIFPILIFYPCLVLLFDFRPIPSTPTFFLIISIINISSQIITCKFERNYKISDFLISYALYYATFLAYIQASICVLLRRNMIFKCTPKTINLETNSTQKIQIFVHLLILGVLILSVVTGIRGIITGSITYDKFSYILWSLINFAMVLIVLHLSYSEDIFRAEYGR